jgi:caffeoyl-CoA O-methyltransferase
MTDPDLFDQVDRYIEELYGGDDPVLDAVVNSLAEADMPQISVSAVQGRLLHVLANLCRAERILEVGTLAGYSTTWLARALPGDGRLITIEADPDHAAVARRNIRRAGLENVVEVRVGAALDLLPALDAEAEGPFDLVFIDADKAPLAEYFQWALRLSRPGTLIIADNVVRKGKVLDPDPEDDSVQGVRRFNELLAGTGATVSVILQTVGRKGHDGLALAVVREPA